MSDSAKDVAAALFLMHQQKYNLDVSYYPIGCSCGFRTESINSGRLEEWTRHLAQVMDEAGLLVSAPVLDRLRSDVGERIARKFEQMKEASKDDKSWPEGRTEATKFGLTYDYAAQIARGEAT